MSTVIPSVSQLRRAIKIAEQIESLEAELAEILGKASVVKATDTQPKRQYNFSPEARAKIAAAQKARWAKHKKATAEDSLPKTKK